MLTEATLASKDLILLYPKSIHTWIINGIVLRTCNLLSQSYNSFKYAEELLGYKLLEYSKLPEHSIFILRIKYFIIISYDIFVLLFLYLYKNIIYISLSLEK